MTDPRSPAKLRIAVVILGHEGAESAAFCSTSSRTPPNTTSISNTSAFKPGRSKTCSVRVGGRAESWP